MLANLLSHHGRTMKGSNDVGSGEWYHAVHTVYRARTVGNHSPLPTLCAGHLTSFRSGTLPFAFSATVSSPSGVSRITFPTSP